MHSKKRKNRKKKHEKIRPTQNTYEIHRNPTTATTSRRRATKRVPRVSPYSPASIDPGFVEIGLVQFSQSVKTTNVTHTLIDTQTDYLNNGTLYAPRYEEAFPPKGKNGLISTYPKPAASPERYPIPLECATAPNRTQTVALAFPGKRTGVTAKIGEIRSFKVVYHLKTAGPVVPAPRTFPR